ncbi:MAG: class II fructose-bisphosphate aldolase family protein [Acidobacteria bacterium]|nr:class II fructose-bisphosphate aldolase family protein [Acidobacteriota bacterium]
MLVSGQTLLDEAVRGGYAIGSFNTYNLEITRAILAAAEARRSAVFLAVGSGALDYGGFAPLTQLVLAAAREATVPVAVHLDHSPTVADCERCLSEGFTSLMIDGSNLPFDENVALTWQTVKRAGEIPVEGELGGVGGDEDSSGAQETAIPMTDPAQARAFVEQTGVASLAIAIGNAHGIYKGEPKLDFDRLAALRDAVPAPLVLHGASGLSDDDLRRAISLGVRKINVNTEIRQTLFGSLDRSLEQGVKGYDVTRLFGVAMEAMQRTVEEKIEVFSGSPSFSS